MTKPEVQKQAPRDNSSRPDNPAFVAFNSKRAVIDKRIDAIRAEMVRLEWDK